MNGRSTVRGAGRARDTQVSEQAEWFVTRLYSGEMTSAEENELHRWLQQDRAHQRAWERALRLWDALEDLKGDEAIERMVMAAAAAAPRARLGFTRRSLALAASLVCAIILGTLGGTLYLTPDSADIFETAVGERKSVQLADGSSLTLNTNSRVLVDFSSKERRIVLDFGEIYLDAEKDARRVLRVEAGRHVIAALGTRFSVLFAGGRTEVAVAEGSVSVSDISLRFPRRDSPTLSAEGEGLVLAAGGLARFEGNGNRAQLKQGDAREIERVQGWRSGLVRFERQPLMRVISEVNRYAPVKILLEDSRIADLPVSAVLRLDHTEMLDQVELLLSSLEEIYSVKVVRHPDRFVLVADTAQAQQET